MAKRYLKRRFTVRETILLCILLAVLLLGLYFGLVFYPIQSRTHEYNDKLAVAEKNLNDVQEDFAEYQRMKNELARIELSGDKTVMPDHTGEHYRELVDLINGILDQIDHPFTTSSSAPQDNVVTRTISLNFTVTEENKGTAATVYDKVRSVLTALMSTGYRSSMRTLRLSAGGGTTGLQNATSITVYTEIEFFELAKEQPKTT